MPANPFQARRTLKTAHGSYTYYDLGALAEQKIGDIASLPFSIRVLLESLLRNVDGFAVGEDDVRRLAGYDARKVEQVEMPFLPGRVVLQDFTGVPCVVDLAAMRDAMKKLGGDPAQINPAVPCDLVIDHSVQVDAFADPRALEINAEKEFERNAERYQFLKWGQQSLQNFSVVPPATGIVHQVNLEYLAQGVLVRDVDGERVAFPDSLVGTDSHTTMINGLGVVGWGVGGIEAEAVMLGQPVYMLTPEVVGFRLEGKLPEGTTATDLVLTVTQMLRAHGVVEKFVEFFGPGVAALSLPDRATIANMAPEYGATMGFFPVDATTLDYLRLTGRSDETVALVEAYCKQNHLFRADDTPDPTFTSVLELDLAGVQPSLAGPKRPQDRIVLSNMKAQWRKDLTDGFGKPNPSEAVDLNSWAGEGGDAAGKAVNPDAREAREEGLVSGKMGGGQFRLTNGAVVIAAITSCTNTSNPDVMVAAGLVARKAKELGLQRKPWVKTSLAPGSKVVTEYLDKAGLSDDLEAIGFHTVGYGCTTCIGNSGPLPEAIETAVREGDLVAASVLSGNRNFEGRYLASPPLVVCYALAGTVDVDLANEPLGRTPDGKDVFLADVWPSQKEIRDTVAQCISADQYREKYGDVFTGNPQWNEVPVSSSELYPWDDASTYIQNPPFFEGMTREAPGSSPIRGARVLALLGDSVTTDHISPAGSIAEKSPAGRFLVDKGVRKADFNSYGSRRGNDRVMTRGTFANVRVRNQLAKGDDGKIPEGGWTRDFSKAGGSEVAYIFDAAMHYRDEGTPLVVLAGTDYGMGSSRDWAAKGVYLLGVRAVIAETFERIDRLNLVFMGVLPLQFPQGENAASLGLDGTEKFAIDLPDDFEPRSEVDVVATRSDGEEVKFRALCRVDTPIEIQYYRNGGILQTVIRKKLEDS